MGTIMVKPKNGPPTHLPPDEEEGGRVPYLLLERVLRSGAVDCDGCVRLASEIWVKSDEETGFCREEAPDLGGGLGWDVARVESHLAHLSQRYHLLETEGGEGGAVLRRLRVPGALREAFVDGDEGQISWDELRGLLGAIDCRPCRFLLARIYEYSSEQGCCPANVLCMRGVLTWVEGAGSENLHDIHEEHVEHLSGEHGVLERRKSDHISTYPEPDGRELLYCIRVSDHAREHLGLSPEEETA